MNTRRGFLASFAAAVSLFIARRKTRTCSAVAYQDNGHLFYKMDFPDTQYLYITYEINMEEFRRKYPSTLTPIGDTIRVPKPPRYARTS